MSGIVIDGQYNIGHICTRQQCDAGRGGRVAMRWVSPAMERRDYTFSEMEVESNRFANVLGSLGFSPGDILFTYLPRMPEQFFAFLGALKSRVVAGTLFSNFGDDALLDRLGDSRARGIVTKRSLLKKLLRIRGSLPALKFVIVVDADEHGEDGILSWSRLMAEAPAEFEAAPTPADTPSVLHYTSGSTGKPKGVLHLHRSVLHQEATTREVLGLREGDVYWCTADQGWVTGTSYGIIGPWSMGITQVHFGGGYSPEQWFSLLQDERVNVWYSAPTALRMLMREDESFYRGFDLSALRSISSVGEPLNPEVASWGGRVLGKEIRDTWFQTETGGIMIANREGVEVRPGSMGRPVCGIEATILDDAGHEVDDAEQGNLCVRAGWPSMFAAYLNNESAYASRFRDGWYYTGDRAWRDGDGYFWFVGRTDDVINTAGHLISPFEIESGLIEIEEIAEAGVIGAPDELLFEKVIAFVSLHRGREWSPELELKLRLHISNRVSSVATPHEIIPLEGIPKNKSGKIMRRVLKARYLGTDAGDLSTMEET
jgi:acetyl-CoA synthetase